MPATQTTLRIASGEIAGTGADDVRIYRGVPYAAPPVGPLRWRPPQPVEPWTGVRDCTRYGPDPIQIVEPVPLRRSLAPTTSEDCLNLNIWAPAEPVPGGAPVVVYFDFGGFIAGSASRERNDGSAYARRGVVCVAVNHRMGVLGFLAHPALSAESPQGVSGNYGFLDVIAALRWVRDNIAAFGGNPDRVIATGGSAGAGISALLLTSPLAQGLVHGIIHRSGSSYRPMHRLAEAEAAGSVLGDDLAALRALPASEVLKLNDVVDPASHPNVEAVRDLLKITYQRPILDGWVFERDVVDAYRSGAFAHVPTILGTVANEAGGAITANIPVRTVAQLRDYLAQSFGPAFFDEAWTYFGAANDAGVPQGLADAWSDNMYSSSARGLAKEIATRQPKTFRYLFSHVGTHTLNPPAHGNDMTYVFGTGDFEERDRRVSDAMLAAFCNFAKTWDPNGPGAPAWSPYDPARENYLTFAGDFAEGTRWRTAQADFIERYYEARLRRG
jgi:para-nitrobenzyl esterase